MKVVSQEVTKVCSRCGITKSHSEYGPNRVSKDGIQAACRKCQNAASIKRYYANAEERRAKMRKHYADNAESKRIEAAKYRAENREDILLYKKAYYQKNKDTPEYKAKAKEYRESAKDRAVEYRIEYREKNSEYLVQKSLEWARKNPEKRRAIAHNYKVKRRAKEAAGMPTKELAEWSISQKKVCYWCGKRCPKNYHIDHYQPLSKGGPHETENLVIACKQCNTRKNAKDPYDFAAQVGRLF